MKYLIDGYNLIFECGLHGKQISGRSVANARTRLLQEIASGLPEHQHASVTVVFDANRRMVREELSEEHFGKIKVLYSIKFDDADAMIEHLIGQHSVPGNLTVVSSDHRLHKAALRRKAKPMDSGDWYDALMEGQLSQAGFSDRQSPEPEPGVDELLTMDELKQLKEDVDGLGNA